MKIYYLQSEYQPGKHRIVKALWDDEVFKFDEGTLSPFLILDVSELGTNRSLAQDLKKMVGRTDINVENKYYIDDSGQLMEKAGWVEHIEPRGI